MSLPTEKKKETRKGFPERESFMVFSAPKMGKTTFAAEWPQCLILDCEHGTEYVTGMYLQEVNSLDELREITGELLALAKKDALPYKTVVIDTIDAVNNWAEQETCDQLGIAQMGQAAYGADWGMSRMITRNVIKVLASLPVNLLVLSHSRWAIVNEVAIGHTIDLPGKLARFAMADVDNIIFIDVKDGKRKLTFHPTGGIEAGSRNPVLDKAGECECSFKAFKALFDKEKPEKEEE